MKSIKDIIKSLKKMIPNNIKPAFTTDKELLIWQKEQEKYIQKN